MKKIYLVIILSLITILNFAQDTIKKFNSEKIIAKIIEINNDEVKYKKFAFQDGPTYVELKSEIKTIVYFNGMVEVFEPQKKDVQVSPSLTKTNFISSNNIEIWSPSRFRQNNTMHGEREIQSVLIQSKDKKIIYLVSKAKEAKTMQYIGFAGIPLGIASYGLFIGSIINGTSTYTGTTLDSGYLTGSVICLAAAIASPILSIKFKKRRNAYNREAIKLYNAKF